MKLHSAHHRHSRAIALVGVLVIIGLLSMISLSLMYRMNAAATSSAITLPSEQAWAAALSGLDRGQARSALRPMPARMAA